MNFEILNSFGLIGAAEDVTNEILAQGLQDEPSIVVTSVLNGNVQYDESGNPIPLVDSIVFINATNGEITNGTVAFLNS